MQAHRALVEIEAEEQGQAVKLAEEILCVERVETAGFGPQPPNDADRDVGIFRKDSEFAEARAPCVVQEAQADADRAGHGLGTIGLVASIERDQAFLVEPLIYPGDRRR